jgi:hypothetical protein
MKDSTKAAIVRTIMFLCILSSISLMYYVHVVKKDYVLFTNPSGPSTLAE